MYCRPPNLIQYIEHNTFAEETYLQELAGVFAITLWQCIIFNISGLWIISIRKPSSVHDLPQGPWAAISGNSTSDNNSRILHTSVQSCLLYTTPSLCVIVHSSKAAPRLLEAIFLTCTWTAGIIPSLTQGCTTTFKIKLARPSRL